MGKWIFALAGIGACVIGGFAANQGRVDLVKVSKAALDAPKVFEEGKKAGLLLDLDEVSKEFPSPPDDQNFALVVPEIIRLSEGELKKVRRFFATSPSSDETAKLGIMKPGLDLAVKESNRTAFQRQRTFETYGAFESLQDEVNICNALLMRARVRGQNGEVEGCLQDYKAAKKIGRLMSQEYTSWALRSASSVLNNASEIAIQLAANDFANDPVKLELLKNAAIESQADLDVNRYVRLSCFASMNNARNRVVYGEEAYASPRKFIKNGVAPDARGRYEQYKGVKMFLKIQSAWEACGHDLIKFENRLRTIDVALEVGMQSPGELFFTVTPAISALSEQRRALANIEATRMAVKLGRWPTLSEINGSFMIDPNTGEKFAISYSGKAPEFKKQEIDYDYIK